MAQAESPKRLLAGAGRRQLGATTWEVEAVRVVQAFSEGSQVPFFRYRSLEGTPSNGQFPLLRAPAGASVELLVTNTLDFTIQPQILGDVTGPEIAPGETSAMSFQMPSPGTRLLTEALLGPAGGPVGFGAVVVSDPAAPGVAEGVDYDREYILLYQDADDRWNLALDAGEQPDTSVYEPNFHTINGITFPGTTEDPDSLMACNVGERVLIRLANLGHVRHAIHFHGYHAEILARNLVPEGILPAKDTFPLPGYTTLDLLLPVHQPGVYPVHPHSLTTVTDNGFYPFGQITLIVAT